MRFEASRRILTDLPAKDILNLALSQFKNVSRSAYPRDNSEIVASGIEATFGSANRADTTIVTVQRLDSGWLLIAETNYRPSAFFWIVLLLLIFSWVGWIIPIAFYLTQRNTVKNAVEACLQRVSNELSRPHETLAHPVQFKLSSIEELEKLASLRERGHVTDEEFAERKRILLGL